MDPQVAAVSPRADHAVSGDRERIRRISQRGDELGLHVHPVRWSDDTRSSRGEQWNRDGQWRGGQWIHDYADAEWRAHCLDSSVAAFEQAVGTRPRRHRYGAGYLTTDLVTRLTDHGFLVDLTPEPRSIAPERRARPVDVESGIDGTPRIGQLPDCSRIPNTAYRPSVDDGLQADDCHGRNIVLVPLTASRRRVEKPRWWRAASRVKHGLKRPPVRMMYPSVPWPDPGLFWDIVERELEAMPRPYVSIAYRTDAPGSPDAVNARAVLERLPSHPLARRLRFEEPLPVAPSLVSPRARAGLSWADAARPEQRAAI